LRLGSEECVSELIGWPNLNSNHGTSEQEN
jgi:hypothetical protein